MRNFFIQSERYLFKQTLVVANWPFIYVDVLWRTWIYDDKLSFLHLNMDKVVKNSTSGKLAYILRIVQFLIDAIKFDRTQIHFLVMFSLLSSLLLLKTAS